MKVVALQHPEDLIDKLEAGLLAPAERERLDAHLAGCGTCRMELAMRSDFATEPPLALPELPQLTLEAPAPARPPSSVAPRRARRQFSLLVIAAAWCATSALAATAAVSSVKVPWTAWFGQESAPAAVTSAKVSPHRAKNPRSVAARPSATPSATASDAVEATSDSAEAANSGAPESTLSAVAPLAEHGRVASPAPHAQPQPTASHGDGAASALGGTAAFPVPDPSANPAAALLAEADRARRAGDGAHAVALYRELEQTYPSSPESGLSVALVAKLLLDRGDAAGAELAYERYLRGGSDALRAEALVGRARALERLGRTSEAVAAWQDVERGLPGTVHARLAAERLEALSDR